MKNTKEEVELLLEDYIRRKQTIKIELDKCLKKHSEYIHNDKLNKKILRLKTKQGCFNTIISELNKILK